jgi:putative ABC transport system permease protein
VFIAFLIYAVLGAFQASFTTAAGPSSQNRLIVSNRINFTQPLPLAYANRISQINGVTNTSFQLWFGGYFQERRNFLLTFAVDPDSYTQIYKELNIPEDQRKAFVEGRDSILVGRSVADQFGWKLGQQVPISSNIWRRADGSSTWPTVVRAIYDGDGKTPTSAVYVHYKYLDEARAFAKDTIGNVIITTASPDQNDAIVAKVDGMFDNSAAETKTTTEEAFNAAFINQQGNLSQIIIAVTGVSFLTILLIVGNAMSGAIRERTGEIAVMKTLGFTSGRIARIVVGETLVIAVIGGGLGLLAASALVGALKTGGATFSAFFSTLTLTPLIALVGVGFMLLLGGLTGAIPAWNAMRVNVISAFRRI